MKLSQIFVPEKNESLEEKTKELLNVERKKNFKFASRFNTLKFSDENVQYFSDLWCEQAVNSSPAQKELVIDAYLVHILGVSCKTVEDFKNNKITPYHEIGLLQSGEKKRKGDTKSFWHAMQSIFPLGYVEEDIQFLIGSGVEAVFTMMNQFRLMGLMTCCTS